MTAETNQESIGQRAIREVRELVAKYAAGEAEIARAYFEQPRTREEDLLWMKHQAGRELGRVYQLATEIDGRLATLKTTNDRAALTESFQKAIEELNHFNLVTEILEWMSGKAADLAELRRYDLFHPDPSAPANEANIRLAETYREIDARIAELGNPAWAPLVQDQGLLEGGGNGFFYVASQLQGGEREERIARAMRVTLEDEVDHGPAHIVELEQLVQSEEDLVLVKELIRKLGDARLRYRNEEFSQALTAARLQEIMDGEIEPLELFYQQSGA
jgi:hypothetical protein